MDHSLNLPKSFHFKIKLLFKAAMLASELSGFLQHGLKWLRIRKGLAQARALAQQVEDDKPLLDPGFPCQEVDGTQAVAQVQAWSARTDGVPVIFASQRLVSDFVEHRQQQDAEGETFDAVLARGEQMDVGGWLQQQYLERRESFRREQDELIAMTGGHPEPDIAFSRKVHGPVQGNKSLYLLQSRGKPAQGLVLGLVPVDPKRPWQIPAYFRYAGWNDTAQADVHVAMFKHWYERYGAVVVAMTHSTVEMRVSRRPADRDEATKLALQMYMFCPDSIDQGAETVGTAAEILLHSDYWFFWWD